jgi:hypothetical protein
MKRLLILSCSRSKRTSTEYLPAFERYDGPTFRLLRRYLKTSTDIPDIRILSAEYGLVRHDYQIPFYEREMTPQRTRELRPQIAKALNRLVKAGEGKTAQSIFVHLSKVYLGAVEGSSILSSRSVTIASGTPGKKLLALYVWLYGEPPERHRRIKRRGLPPQPQVRGRKIDLEKRDVLNAVRHAIEDGLEVPVSNHSWYVMVDGRRVSAKWIISLITGFPLSTFHTDAAKQALSDLGIRVHAI